MGVAAEISSRGTEVEARGSQTVTFTGAVEFNGTVTHNDDVTMEAGTQLFIDDGTTNDPGIAFRDDTDSGFHRSGANTVDTVAGTSRSHVVGQFGVTANTNAFSVAGALIYTGNVAASWGVDQNAYAVPAGVTVVEVDVTAAGIDLHGIAAGSDGQVVVFHVLRTSANPLNVTNENAAASAADRIRTITAASTAIAAGSSFVVMYSATDARWHQIG